METVINRANAHHKHLVPCPGTWAWALCSMVLQLVRRLAAVARLLAMSGLALTAGVGPVIAAEVTSFLGYRARPSGILLLTICAYWVLAGCHLKRQARRAA